MNLTLTTRCRDVGQNASEGRAEIFCKTTRARLREEQTLRAVPRKIFWCIRVQIWGNPHDYKLSFIQSLCQSLHPALLINCLEQMGKKRGKNFTTKINEEQRNSQKSCLELIFIEHFFLGESKQQCQSATNDLSKMFLQAEHCFRSKPGIFENMPTSYILAHF